jgi:hypothetical protein
MAGESLMGARKGRAKEMLAKTAMLSLIGSWGRVSNFRYTCITTNDCDDCRFQGEIMKGPAPGSSSFHDITYRQTVRSMGSMLPLNLVGLSIERLNVARCIAICLKHMRPEKIISIQVDAVCFQPCRKRARMIVEELEQLTYNNVHLATRRPLAKYAGPLQDPIQSNEKIFQLKQLDSPLYPGGELERHHAERPVVPEQSWRVVEEHGEAFADEVIQHVLDGSSACIQGAPGTGKSHLLERMRNALTDSGTRVAVIAPTNAAARLIGGTTAHAFITRMASCSNGWDGVILCDEISMCSLAMLSVLDSLRIGDCRIVSFGDFFN